MAGLSDVTLGDIRRGLLRYRPVALTVLAIFVIVQLVPGDEEPSGGRLAGDTQPTVQAGDGAATTTAAVAPAPASPSPSFDSSPSVTFSSGFTSDVGSFDDDDDFSDSDSSGFSPDDSSGSGSGFVATTTTTEPSRPLAIVAKAWATSTAGTPLDKQGVPAGSLPVGKRIGTDDKRSFIRLSGTTTELVLAEDPAGTRAPPAGASGVRACQITVAGWAEGEGQTFPGPAFDAGQCVTGARSADGLWTFDFGQFPLRTDGRGFALVPTDGSAIDFQVAFKPS